jgi:D-alanine-D-alanine ligase
LKQAGVPIAKWFAFTRYDFDVAPQTVCAKAATLGFPLFVKPANLGSSVGVRKVQTIEQLYSAVEYAFRFDNKVLAEEAISGREIECSVIGDDQLEASVPGEIVVKHPDGFYSYAAKYIDESGAILKIPAALSPRIVTLVQSLSKLVFKTLECSGLARVDFFLDRRGRLLVNEINTMPGFTSMSMYPKLWEASGMSQSQLIDRLIEIAIKRYSQKNRLRQARSA